MCDIQKANMWKRISAALFDVIMLVIAVVGAALLLSYVLGYDQVSGELASVYDRYEETYGVPLDLLEEEYAALSDAERANLDEARKAFSADEAAIRLMRVLFNYTLIIAAFSVLIAYLLLEFLVPLLFGNGQTLGKKVFGVGVMREDGVKINPLMLFVRTVLGKYTLETMIPIMVVLLIFFNAMGIFGLVVLGILIIVELAVLMTGATRPMIHDKMARTICVDIASQLIFESEEDLIAYKKRVQAERAQREEY